MSEVSVVLRVLFLLRVVKFVVVDFLMILISMFLLVVGCRLI